MGLDIKLKRSIFYKNLIFYFFVNIFDKIANKNISNQNKLINKYSS